MIYAVDITRGLSSSKKSSPTFDRTTVQCACKYVKVVDKLYGKSRSIMVSKREQTDNISEGLRGGLFCVRSYLRSEGLGKYVRGVTEVHLLQRRS